MVVAGQRALWLAAACAALSTQCGHAGGPPAEGPQQLDPQGGSDYLEVRCRLLPGAHEDEDEVVCGGRRFVQPGAATEAAELPIGSTQFLVYVCAAVACIVTAAIAAGLTMGLVSLDEFDLDLLLEMRPEELESHRAREDLLQDQKYAMAVKPLIADHFFQQALPCCIPKKLDPSNHHYLLVTLLLVNAVANEALPVFLDHLVPAWVAVLISVSFVLVFGEIIPSAIFTGPNQLAIAAKLAGLVSLLKVLLVPLVWPVSLLLDTCLEHEAGTTFSRGKIKALVRLHEHDDKWLHDNGLTRDEIDMIHGTLDLHMHVVQEIQENMSDAKMLPMDTVLDENTMADILHWGHSRVFVYEGDKNNVRGVLMVKKLIVVNPDSKRLISQMPLRHPIVVSPQDTLLETLNRFQTGHSHMAIISSDPDAVLQAWKTGQPIPEGAEPTGFLTLEDIIEELIREDVFDEDERRSAMSILGRGGRLRRLKSLASGARHRVEQRKSQVKVKTAAGHTRRFSDSRVAPLMAPLLGHLVGSRQDAPADEVADGVRQSGAHRNNSDRPARRALAEV